MELITETTEFIKNINWAISLFAAIPLAIVANLLTPRVANWLSGRSEEKTKSRIAQLEQELNEIHDLAHNSNKLSYLNFIVLFRVLALIAMGGAADFFGVIGLPLGAVFYLSAIIQASKHVQVLRRCQEFVKYENETTTTIEELLEKTSIKQRQTDA